MPYWYWEPISLTIDGMTISSTWLRRSAVGFAALAVVSGAACSSDDAGSPNDDAGAAKVMASTSIWADVVSNVACGEVEVTSIIPAGADAHDFELGAKEADAVANADLLVVNGLGLEGGISSVVDSASGAGVDVLEIGEVIEVPDTDAVAEGHADDHDEAPTKDDHGHDGDEAGHADDGHAEDDGHGHGDDDPHVWLNPDLVAAAVPSIRDALGHVDDLGVSAEQLTTCADDYIAELAALSAELDSTFAALTPQQQVLVTDHEALGHFASRFGFEIVGTVLPSTSSIGETNPRDLDELTAAMKEHGVTTVFAGAGNSTSIAETLTNALGTEVTVEHLNVESLNPDDGAADYLELMRSNAARIAQS